MSPLQKKVCDAARVILLKSGVKGVCLDKLMEDYEIEKDFDAAVHEVVLDTLFWEGKL